MTLRSGSPFSLMYTFFDKEGPTAEKVLETETKTFETDIETFLMIEIWRPRRTLF